jgi:Undecaprenyl-phosphate galactose phosphotransferase WbaP
MGNSVMSANSTLAVAPIVIPAKAPSFIWPVSACIVTADLVALVVVYCILFAVRYVMSPGYDLSLYWQLLPVMSLFVGAFYLQGLYPGLLIHPADEIRQVFYGTTAVCLLIEGGTVLLRNPEAYWRLDVMLAWVLVIPTVLTTRLLARRMFSGRAWWGIPSVVLGTATSTKRVARMLGKSPSGLRLTGVLTNDCVVNWPDDLPPVLGHLSAAPAIAKKKIAQYAVVALPQHPTSELCDQIEECCKGFRRVLLIPDLFSGVCSLGVLARDVGGELAFEFPQRLFQGSTACVKRFLDIAVSLMALLPLTVVFLVLSVFLKLNSKGPVFFAHRRYGRAGKVFKAFKFRTMIQDGDEVLAQHLRQHPQDVLDWELNHKLKNDPRVTAIGKWMRRYSVDELPQLWNILIGDMSLVGPRPIVEAEIQQYGRGFGLFVRVRPGLTGLWQVSGRNDTTYEERVAYDGYYVRNWSIWLDLYIIVRTVRVVVTGDGAY